MSSGESKNDQIVASNQSIHVFQTTDGRDNLDVDLSQSHPSSLGATHDGPKSGQYAQPG